MSTANDYRRVAWHYLKLAGGTSNPKTGASLRNLGNYGSSGRMNAQLDLKASATSDATAIEEI